MGPQTSAFVGGIIGSVVGGIVGAIGGMVLSEYDGGYSKLEREELIGGAFVGGVSLGATLGAVVAAGSSIKCPT
jgi:hypothetical protein